MSKDLLTLRTTGFAKLRDGRIHMRCPSCGRKWSNMKRQSYDPPNGFLAELGCEKCSMGGKDMGESYFDASGTYIEFDPSPEAPDANA